MAASDFLKELKNTDEQLPLNYLWKFCILNPKNSQVIYPWSL